MATMSRLGSTTVSIRAGGDRWRRNSELLDQYLRREMQDAEKERKRVYPKTWDTQIQRTVPIIWRIARELATLYLRPPARKFVGASASETLAIEAAYRRLKVNRRLRTAQEQMSVVNNATVWVWLTSTGFKLICPPIHNQWVWSNQVVGQDVEDVAEWRIRMPVVTDPFATSASTAMALITPTKAIWETGPSGWAGKGIWAKDGTNPFGRIPVVIFRGSDPAPGEFLAPCPEDNLDLQRATNHDSTMLGDLARKQGYAQAVAEGLTQTQANEIEVGPESVVGVPTGGSYSYESPEPKLVEAGTVLDNFVKLSIACNGMSPATVMKSTGITALAKIVENIDREVERQRAKDEFETGEQPLYELIQLATKIRSGGLELLPRDIVVEVQHREPVTPADPANDAQAKTQRKAMHVESSASIIATEKAISLDDAQKIAVENQKLDDQLEAAKAKLVAARAPAPPPDAPTTPDLPPPANQEGLPA